MQHVESIHVHECRNEGVDRHTNACLKPSMQRHASPIYFPTMSFTSDCRTHKSLPRNPFSRRSCNSASVTSDTPTNQVTCSKDLQESAAEDASFGAVGLSLALTGPMPAIKRGSKSSCVYHKTSAKDKWKKKLDVLYMQIPKNTSWWPRIHIQSYQILFSIALNKINNIKFDRDTKISYFLLYNTNYILQVYGHQF